METNVAYYRDDDGTGRPAINVKVHAAGRDYWHPALECAYGDLSDHVPTELAYERVQSDFWQAAQEIATQRGLGEITQEGRSGGWLVFTDGRDPQDVATLCDPDEGHTDADSCEAVTEWLAAYRAMVEWADAFIADAPRKVRDLAQQLAMDEAGEDAARRMFAIPLRVGEPGWARADSFYLFPEAEREVWLAAHAEDRA